MVKLSESEFRLIDEYMRSHFGINLERKQYLVENRLSPVLERSGTATFEEYWRKLHADSSDGMVQGLLDCLTTNYTYFYREEKHFSFLEKLVSGVHHPLNVWCAGCATGQESYTLAMLLTECREKGKLNQAFRIFATDISKGAIEAAQTGIYNETDCLRLPENWKKKYFRPQTDGKLIIATGIRDTVRYLRQNLMDTKPGAVKYDIIFCRNVLIYFREKERSVVVNNLSEALRPGGYLFIGHTESLFGCDADLEYVRPAVYRKPKETANAEKKDRRPCS